MKDCKKIHPLLSLYRENQLSAREKAAVEKHVAECPAAREELKQEVRLNKALKELPEPKMPRDLHDKIMTRLYGKPAPSRVWPRASWGLAAAAGLAFIFCIQNFNWVENKNSEIVLKPAVPVSDTGSTKVSPQTEMALKSQTNRPNPPTVSMAPQPEMAEPDVKIQSDAAPLAQAQTAGDTPLPMALAPAPRDKKMNAMPENGQLAFQSNSHIAQEDASVPEVNDNGQTETKSALNYRAISPDLLDMEPGQPVKKQVPQFLRLDVLEIESGKYQLNWQTNLATKGQIYLLDSTGNTLQAIAESTSFTYDHQMTIDASIINTDFFIKVLATYLNGNQAVTVSNVLKHQ